MNARLWLSIAGIVVGLGCGSGGANDGSAGPGADPSATAEPLCRVKEQGDGSKLITCDDGTKAVVRDGVDGVDGADGMKGDKGDTGSDGIDGRSCNVADNGDGSKTITCDDGTSVTVSDGAKGDQGGRGSAGGLVWVDAMDQEFGPVVAYPDSQWGYGYLDDNGALWVLHPSADSLQMLRSAPNSPTAFHLSSDCTGATYVRVDDSNSIPTSGVDIGNRVFRLALDTSEDMWTVTNAGGSMSGPFESRGFLGNCTTGSVGAGLAIDMSLASAAVATLATAPILGAALPLRIEVAQ